MNKKTIITILFALVVVAEQGQKVWKNPGYRNEPCGFQFDVNEVEFRPDETGYHAYLCNQKVSRERTMCMGSAKSPPA